VSAEEKTINDLSEPMKKLKREAWREAKRRTRARKQVETTVVQTHVIQTTDREKESRISPKPCRSSRGKPGEKRRGGIAHWKMGK
ncbi:uncharacterized protein DAT39_023490, partial [Clarias magur]